MGGDKAHPPKAVTELQSELERERVVVVVVVQPRLRDVHDLLAVVLIDVRVVARASVTSRHANQHDLAVAAALGVAAGAAAAAAAAVAGLRGGVVTRRRTTASAVDALAV